MTSQDSLLETLQSSKLYQDYEHAFGDATGLPLTLRSPEAWQVAQRDNPHRNGFCAAMAAQSRTCAACLRSQQELTEKAAAAPATVSCFAGLCDSAVPVRLGEQLVGLLQTGQIMLQKPTETRFKKLIDELDRLGVTYDRQLLHDAWFKTPVLGKREYQATVELLRCFGEQLSAATNQLALRQANSEPPSIVRAKQFIQEHLGEPLSLGQVAKAVNMSRFYFCKTFRKITGLNFTDYVSRLRVERSKQLLLNPHLRVSEIAYEVGFQSLTHFNRVFRRVVGKSPTDYRSQVSQVAA
jgi:AraC-like DNA-binding protein/ligand-binding sensor protein